MTGYLTSSLHGWHMQQAKGTFKDNTYVQACSCRWWQHLTTAQRHNSQIKFLSHSENDSRLLLLVFAILIINNTFILMSHYLWNNQSPAFAYLLTAGIMKGTEVPNPRRSSGCDCTCVLTITVSCLPCACLCKVRSRTSDALSQALCNLSLA